jgi:hypothetical protein
VFGGSDIWMPGEAAVVRQYPTPEPATALIMVLGASMLSVIRRRRS